MRRKCFCDKMMFIEKISHYRFQCKKFEYYLFKFKVTFIFERILKKNVKILILFFINEYNNSNKKNQYFILFTNNFIGLNLLKSAKKSLIDHVPPFSKF